MSKTWSVSELNRYIKDQFEADDVLREVTLSGEIANFKRHGPSGHCYFSLKDAKASLTCVMWRSHVSRLTFSPQDGMTVLVRGQVTVFERNGAYQLYVSRMLAEGAGALAIRFEELKQKLAAEGVFKTAATRRPLPTYPERIALVTSSTGAVIRDMLTVMRRRAPYVQVILAPATVQGSQGAASICAALTALYQREDIDLILQQIYVPGRLLLQLNRRCRTVQTFLRPSTTVAAAWGRRFYGMCAWHACNCRAPVPAVPLRIREKYCCLMPKPWMKGACCSSSG